MTNMRLGRIACHFKILQLMNSNGAMHFRMYNFRYIVNTIPALAYESEALVIVPRLHCP
jgi:hypothetical protein